jgi:transcription initiation factor TFIIB
MIKKDSKELSEINSSIRSKATEVQTCPECGSIRLIHDQEAAEIICMYCGSVDKQQSVDKEIEGKSKWDLQRSKCVKTDMPLTYTIHDKGSSTIINWHERDIYGESFSAVNQKKQVYHLRKWQRRIRVSDSTEHNLAFALSEITKIANNLNLPKNVLETAAVIYRKTSKEQLIRGYPIQSVTSAVLYLVCRQYKLPVTLDEFTQVSTVSKKEIGRIYRCLIKKFDYSVPPLQPSQYITKFFNQFTTQENAEEVAHKILSAAKDSKLTSGYGLTGTVAAANYATAVLIGERKTYREIAKVAHITEATVKNRYKELEKRLMIEVSI